MSQDKLTTLAISMQRQKGVYALLLGSGVSQASSIPTGWAILNRLIQKVALVQDEPISGDPVAWYQEKFEKEPSYGDLLEMAANTPAERAAIIQEYIEPNEDERELGLKQPTEAHRAIAQLVSSGHVRVIVTTNFDRLIEIALTEVGITPSVISSEDGINGSRPLAHNPCTIVKVHGDYIDARIRNTVSELSGYDEGMQCLLRQVFREYGLVISGWSAEWDTALAALLQDERSPWFSTYWVAYNKPKEGARQIIDARKAGLITHMGAEEFFTKLDESVQALADHESTELLSLAIAEASLKRYLDDPTKRIRTFDLVVSEATRVSKEIFSDELGDMQAVVSQESVETRITSYESQTDILRTLFAAGCFWGEEEHTNIWSAALEHLSNFEPLGSYDTGWSELRYYPSVLLLYTGGIAALASRQYKTLNSLFYETTNKVHTREERFPLMMSAHTSILREHIAGALLPRHVPQLILPLRIKNSDWFWTPLSKYIPNQERRLELLFEFVYLFGLAHTDIALNHPYFTAWGPHGTIRHRYDDLRIGAITKEIEELGDFWGPLQAGMFGGSLDRVQKAQESFHSRLEQHLFW